ncbi:MAG: MmcQ/YjbR family DNA-binding protein [Myxococcota bacterium]|nr:MmcQ/YjbR family DNA-binding protein [Myxococcota bacterium]
MQFTKKLHPGIQSGAIDCSIRIWQQPRVKVGGRYRLGAGEVVVDDLQEILLDDVTPALARRSGFDDLDDLLATAKHGRGERVFLVAFHYEEDGAPSRPKGPKRPKGRPTAAQRKRKAPKTPAARRKLLVSLAEALPEAEVTGGQHLKFAVRKKTFGYYLCDHHGDGMIALCCKALAGEQQRLVSADPERFKVPDYLGARGWVSYRIDLDEVDWDVADALLRESYRLVAPKRLVTAMEAEG